MRIAQIAPLAERIPPKKYGGTERVVHALTEELVRRGHEVTLFASGDSITTAELVAVYPRCLREDRQKDLYGANKHTLLNIGLAYSRHQEFDIIHDHSGEISLPTANSVETPTLLTLHGPITTETRKLLQVLKNPYLVTISEAQRRFINDINVIDNVYNGLNMEHFPFSAKHDGYLLYVGRISVEKGVHHAIDAANQLNMRLIIAAKLDPGDLPYFREYVEPHLCERITWIGEVGEEERNQLMTRAICFLHPVTWPEPFGLTLIESMACGCPVVAFSKGSIPELIVDGKTGFVVSDVDEMVNAILKIDTIDRSYCRKHSLQKFNAKVMADGYEKVYAQILQKRCDSQEKLYYSVALTTKGGE